MQGRITNLVEGGLNIQGAVHIKKNFIICFIRSEFFTKVQATG